MSNELLRPNKRLKKETSSPSRCVLFSLPEELAMNCLFRLSRSERMGLSIVSKSHRSLVLSPELCLTRSLMGCTEEFGYVCLSYRSEPTPRWFVLSRKKKTLEEIAARKTVNWRLRPIPSYPYQPPISSSFVMIDYGIYVIGGVINGSPTSEVLLFDCLSHTWRRVRSMKVARSSAAANVVDGKIYVFGGCEEELDSSNWGEVFDPKTQTWDTLLVSEDPDEIRKNTRMMNKSVVMEDRIYAVDEKDQSFYYFPREGILRRGNMDSKRGNRNNWCVIGKTLYCSACCGKIMWCEPDDLEWKEVKGLDFSQWCVFALKANNQAKDKILMLKFHMIQNGFSRLSSNSRGNIVVFWKVYFPLTEQRLERLELWCAEISLERREGDEIWGKIEWADEVSQLDPLSYGFELLYSVFVNV